MDYTNGLDECVGWLQQARLNRFLYFCMGIKVANFCQKVLNPQVLIGGCLLYLNV